MMNSDLLKFPETAAEMTLVTNAVAAGETAAQTAFGEIPMVRFPGALGLSGLGTAVMNPP
jgi:hypothetical protein